MCVGAGAVATQAAAAAKGTKVPVVACPTTRGITGHPRTRYPNELRAELPPALTTKLSFYSDGVRNLTPVLGPRGWKCEVQVGADGSTDLTVHPPGTGQASNTAITVQGIPACQGCMYALVCPQIPESSHEVGVFYGRCPSTAPDREEISTSISTSSSGAKAYVSTFIDPAHVKGDGVPSGGPDPANGVLNYDWSRHDGDAAALETCTLPNTEYAICHATILRFANHHWGMPAGFPTTVAIS
jgi:hypothetical protein